MRSDMFAPHGSNEQCDAEERDEQTRKDRIEEQIERGQESIGHVAQVQVAPRLSEIILESVLARGNEHDDDVEEDRIEKQDYRRQVVEEPTLSTGGCVLVVKDENVPLKGEPGDENARGIVERCFDVPPEDAHG